MEKVDKNTWYQNPASYFVALLAVYGLWILFDLIKIQVSGLKFVDSFFPVILISLLAFSLFMLVLKGKNDQ